MAVETCWSFMKCGKETDCPAHPNSGSACWNVEGTLCRGQKQGTYAEKVSECRTKCEFYSGVMSGTIRVI